MTLADLVSQYAHHGIKLVLVPKRVKNINFRLTPVNEPHFTSLLAVSYPARMAQSVLLTSLQSRLAWAIGCQVKLGQSKPTPSAYLNDAQDLQSLTWQSEVYFAGQKISVQALLNQYQDKVKHPTTHAAIAQALVDVYTTWLREFIAQRQPYWQAKVNKTATKITPYTMKTRWGSCSPRAKTIRLSIWLAQFAPSCADYVLVHELCHLHEANHSPRFWAQVARVMPDYQIWHDQLKYANQPLLLDNR